MRKPITIEVKKGIDKMKAIQKSSICACGESKYNKVFCFWCWGLLTRGIKERWRNVVIRNYKKVRKTGIAPPVAYRIYREALKYLLVPFPTFKVKK